MNVLIVLVHPESKSLNASLARDSAAALEAAGHTVEISDLYAQNWNPVIDRADYQVPPDQRLGLLSASRQRLEQNAIPGDILAEQEKVLRADAVIFQYPLWWFSMPAMLRGWFERVYSFGFGYGLGVHSDTRWGDRYGEGRLTGKRAMLCVTTGGWAEHYSDRAINGPIEDLLYPVNHGLLFYAGFDVLPPFIAYRADSMSTERYEETVVALKGRLDRLFDESPIPYRLQNGGDYEIPSLSLRAGLERGDENSPFALHKKT
jgi:NAD(P)H dehydrogenase (quinone)